MEGLYFECASGISGDMTVASLLDLGADKAALLEALKTVPLTGYKVEVTKVKKAGIDCTDFNVILEEENHDHDMEYLFGHEHASEHHHHDHEHEHAEHHEHHHHDHEHQHSHEHDHHHHHSHRGMPEIREIIEKSGLSENVKALSLKIFTVLANAEAKAHGLPVDQVHFHEVGAVDSIIDIISIAFCFENLGIEKVFVNKIFEGSGTIRCQHGILPIPVPAVANIVGEYNLKLNLSEEKGEFITPTGAAFLAAVMTDSKLPVEFTIKAAGLGAGKRTYERPNFLRTFIIEYEEMIPDEHIVKLESNIDDSTGEQLGFVMEELFKAGARDVHYVPCFMKKNRPGWVLNVICTEEIRTKLEQIIFENTTTIGIRRIPFERSFLQRKIQTIKTEFGEISVKCVTIDGETRAYPEYESVARLCREHNFTYSDAYDFIKKLITSGSGNK